MAAEAALVPSPTGQEQRNYPQRAALDPLGDGRAHGFVLPRTDAARAHEHRAGRAPVEGALDAILPRIAGDKVPAIQLGLDIALAQAMSQGLGVGKVGAMMGQKESALVGRGQSGPGVEAGVELQTHPLAAGAVERG